MEDRKNLDREIKKLKSNKQERIESKVKTKNEFYEKSLKEKSRSPSPKDFIKKNKMIDKALSPGSLSSRSPSPKATKKSDMPYQRLDICFDKKGNK